MWLCDTANGCARSHVDGTGVHHRSGVLSVEPVAFEQLDLAAPAFFGGRADHRQRQPEIVDDRRQRERRPDGDRGDQVVPARVSEAGQRVVFGAQRDVQVATARCARRTRCRAHSRHP